MSNVITVIGFVARPPEVKPAGQREVVKFSIGDPQGKDKTPIWFAVDCWTTTLQDFALKYLKKGSQVVVTGRLKTRTYEGRDGVKTSLDIDCRDIQFAPGRRDDERNPAQTQAPLPTTPTHTDPPPVDDDIPF